MFVARAMLVRQALEQTFEVVLPPEWAHVNLGPEANPAYVPFLLANDDIKCRNVAPDTCEAEAPPSPYPLGHIGQLLHPRPDSRNTDT